MEIIFVFKNEKKINRIRKETDVDNFLNAVLHQRLKRNDLLITVPISEWTFYYILLFLNIKN